MVWWRARSQDRIRADDARIEVGRMLGDLPVVIRFFRTADHTTEPKAKSAASRGYIVRAAEIPFLQREFAGCRIGFSTITKIHFRIEATDGFRC